MQNKKDRIIKRQRFAIRTFWTTVFFFLGFLFAIWQTWELAHEDVLTRVSPAMNLIIILLFVELFVILIMFFAIGKREKPKSSEVLEQIEKLGKLKGEGHISEEEFEKEKKKLWEQ
jgi:uncharacterized membrane protein